MKELPKTKIVACPQCGADVEREIVWFHGREILADRGCLCDDCEAERHSALQTLTEDARHLAQWNARVPEDYHRAQVDRVPKELRPALKWQPCEKFRRLGITGPPRAGKTMVAALIARELKIPFRWTNGFAARGLYNAAVSAEGDERRIAAATWLRWQECPLLVLDDVDKGKPTEAWSSALFALLEARNGHCLPTIWTANLAPGALARKFKLAGDSELADAIERRLCGGSLVITVSK